MYFAVITSKGVPIAEPAEQMIELTLSKIAPVATRGQVKRAIAEAFEEMSRKAKDQSVGLPSLHA